MSTAAVVPVFDETGGSLARTVEGLASQTAAPEEIVVVDDASARPLTMPGVDVLRLPQNSGLSQARNEGAANTDAAYLLFVNCDVVLTPDWLERGLAYLNEHPETGAVGGRIVPVEGPQVLRDWRLQHIEPKVHRSPPAGPTPVSWLVGHALLVRRDVFDEVGGFDPRFRTARRGLELLRARAGLRPARRPPARARRATATSVAFDRRPGAQKRAQRALGSPRRRARAALRRSSTVAQDPGDAHDRPHPAHPGWTRPAQRPARLPARRLRGRRPEPCARLARAGRPAAHSGAAASRRAPLAAELEVVRRSKPARSCRRPIALCGRALRR